MRKEKRTMDRKRNAYSSGGGRKYFNPDRRLKKHQMLEIFGGGHVPHNKPQERERSVRGSSTVVEFLSWNCSRRV